MSKHRDKPHKQPQTVVAADHIYDFFFNFNLLLLCLNINLLHFSSEHKIDLLGCMSCNSNFNTYDRWIGYIELQQIATKIFFYLINVCLIFYISPKYWQVLCNCEQAFEIK